MASARETLLDFFRDFADLDAEFLVYDDGFRERSYSYRETAARARAFAARLRQAGISSGDKIVLYSENRPEWVMALWGALLAGVIAAPVDFRSAPEFAARIADIVKARAILAGDETEAPAHDNVWPIAGLNAAVAPGETAASILNDQILDDQILKDQIAEIIFTSGATAEPKGVVITHRNVLANIVPVEGEVRKYVKYSRPFAPIRFLNLLPLSHMFGQAMAAFIPPMLPGVVVFMRGFNPHEIVRQIRVRRISVLVAVPAILEILREHLLRLFPELERQAPPDPAHWMRRWWRYRRVHRLFGWKFWAFIAGAAPLAPDLEAFFSRLGFVVIQGYGLTETAPIVTLNHPFHARPGSVGKPIGGVEVKIAADGEILVRGENVTSGYYERPADTADAFAGGWFHTGDIGELAPGGDLKILGRKKEMIVTPEGLNVFPEDVEAALKRQPGVRDAAAIGTDRVHAALILEPGADAAEVVRGANAGLADYQRIRGFSVWPHGEFPRTEGTRKLKRHEIARGAPPPKRAARFDPLAPLESLTSLERVERMVALGLDESEMNGGGEAAEPRPAIEFPSWNRAPLTRAVRRIALPGLLLPLTRVFARIRVEGLENLAGLEPPVIFASNHQSYLDVPVILAALPPRWRYLVAPAMRKEFFHEHFHARSFTNSLNYYLSAGLFNAFPLPQREAGALAALRYMGQLANGRWCPLIFPEGKMTEAGEIAPFQPGVGMLAARLNLPVAPLRITGLDRVLHRSWKMARRGVVSVRFGAPVRLEGGDYAALAQRVEQAVRGL